MWWDLNRWSYFPTRGETILGDTVVTPTEDAVKRVEAEARERARRAMVTRIRIVPFLLEQLDPTVVKRNEVRAAAMLALAKVSHDEAAVALLFRYAEDTQAPALVRESAALAIGMLRRDDAKAQMPGERLDAARSRLLTIVDDAKAPDRTRAFAGLALGMLGDQPFGNAFTKDGRVITRALWARTTQKYSSAELPIALLTAIGMQPSAGTAGGVKEELQKVVHGRRVGRRSWSDGERAHALTALVRQEGSGWPMRLFRVVTAKRIPASVRQAAFLSLAAKGSAFTGADRLDAAEATQQGIRLARDDLSRGLGLVALGRLVSADVAAGSAILVKRSSTCATLLAEARHGAYGTRGFAALALGLAVRGATSADSAVRGDADVLKFAGSGRDVLARGFERSKEARVRGAYATALGLLGTQTPPAVRLALAEVLGDRGQDPALRGHVAVALGQMGERSAPVRKAMRTALWDKRSVALRSQAALAMSFLGGRAEAGMLIQELRNARSQWVLQQVAVALGQLGDVRAVPAIIEVAADERRGDEVRALAIASLGLLGDPEPKPSILRLTLDANYPARTDALHEAFSIL
jgi:HEAT repeat protein